MEHFIFKNVLLKEHNKPKNVLHTERFKINYT